MPHERREIADAVVQTGGRRLIIGTGCVTLVTTPESNLRAARARWIDDTKVTGIHPK